MSKKRKNAGEGYGYMFSGAFAKKSDAVKKESTRKGSFVKSIYVQGQHRYAVMTPRTNPRKPRKNSVATEILAQLGGRRFSTMTGAKHFTSSGSSLTFRLPSNFARDGINAVRITLDANDTYTMKFMRIRGTNVHDVAERDGVYNDSLQSVFSSVTGLDTSMGSFGRNPYEPAVECRVCHALVARSALQKGVCGRCRGKTNPTELMVMGANPATKLHKHFAPSSGWHEGAAERAYAYADRMREQYPGRKVEIHERSNGAFDVYVLNEPAGNPHEYTVPANTTITIRTNPTNPDRYTSAHARAAGITRDLGWTPLQKRIARMVRKASGSEAARLGRSYRRHKAESRSRGAEKVFHELYGRNNPICGHIVSGEPCTRKPGHKGPHLPQGATMRPRSRLRNAWKPQRNPSAAALHATFAGKEGKWIEVFNEPHMAKMDVAQLGELLALYVKPISGGQVQQITFPKSARPLVVSDETARQIYFVGGDQNITPALAVFGARDRGGVCELGECTRIDYKQRKEHVPDPDADEWRHAFGEESGVRPVLLYDQQKQRLLLEGGAYEIRAEGIVN